MVKNKMYYAQALIVRSIASPATPLNLEQCQEPSQRLGCPGNVYIFHQHIGPGENQFINDVMQIWAFFKLPPSIMPQA